MDEEQRGPLEATTFEVAHKLGMVVINVHRTSKKEHFVWTPKDAREIARLLVVAADAAETGR